jgi:hypothetical protein
MSSRILYICGYCEAGTKKLTKDLHTRSSSSSLAATKLNLVGVCFLFKLLSYSHSACLSAITRLNAHHHFRTWATKANIVKLKVWMNQLYVSLLIIHYLAHFRPMQYSPLRTSIYHSRLVHLIQIQSTSYNTEWGQSILMTCSWQEGSISLVTLRSAWC